MKITTISLYLFTLAIFFSKLASASKVLVAGDSWASFMCVQNSFTTVFNNYADPIAFNHPGCWLTTQVGHRAEEWMGTRQHKMTLKAIKKDHLIKVLFISLGGNDLLNYANKNMTAEEQQHLFEYIENHLRNIINSYKAVRPDIKIIISGYDYPRFTHDHPISAYKKAFNEMGQPTPQELNAILKKFSFHMMRLHNGKDIAYIHHLGLMHYFDGNSDMGLGKYQTLHPDLISHPRNPFQYGGIPLFQGARQSMLRITNKLIDAFHLSEHGYYRIAEHTYRLYLKQWIRD